MVARLLAVPAVLAVLAGGLVLGPVGPAAACSCVTNDPVELADHADVAFVGVLTSQRSDDDVVAHLFTVEDVLAGDVRRSQDVVTPHAGEASCGVEWATGATMVVLGRVDERGRVASDLCSGSVPAGAAAYDATVEALGEPRDPLPGRSMVALDPTDAQDAAVGGRAGRCRRRARDGRRTTPHAPGRLRPQRYMPPRVPAGSSSPPPAVGMLGMPVGDCGAWPPWPAGSARRICSSWAREAICWA